MGIIIIFIAAGIWGILKLREAFKRPWTSEEAEEHIKNRKWGDR